MRLTLLTFFSFFCISANAAFTLTDPNQNNFELTVVNGGSSTMSIDIASDNLGDEITAERIYGSGITITSSCVQVFDEGNENCTMDLEIGAGVTGTKRVQFTTSAGTIRQNITINRISDPATGALSLSIIPGTSINYGSVSDRAIQFIYVRNDGTTQDVIAPISGGNGFSLIRNDCSGQSLLPGNVCRLVAEFDTTGLSPLTYTHDLDIKGASDPATTTVTLEAYADVPGQPRVEIETGIVKVDETACLLDPPNGDSTLCYYEADTPTGSSTEVSSVTCDTDGNCSVSIQHKVSNEPVEFLISVFFKDETSTIDEGNGLAIAVTPDPVALGNIEIGQSATQTVSVTNTTSTFRIPLPITVSKTNAQVSITNNVCATLTSRLNPGESCTFDVTATPTALGADTDVVTVTTGLFFVNANTNITWTAENPDSGGGGEGGGPLTLNADCGDIAVMTEGSAETCSLSGIEGNLVVTVNQNSCGTITETGVGISLSPKKSLGNYGCSLDIDFSDDTETVNYSIVSNVSDTGNSLRVVDFGIPAGATNVFFNAGQESDEFTISPIELVSVNGRTVVSLGYFIPGSGGGEGSDPCTSYTNQVACQGAEESVVCNWTPDEFNEGGTCSSQPSDPCTTYTNQSSCQGAEESVACYWAPDEFNEGGTCSNQPGDPCTAYTNQSSCQGAEESVVCSWTPDEFNEGGMCAANSGGEGEGGEGEGGEGGGEPTGTAENTAFIVDLFNSTLTKLVPSSTANYANGVVMGSGDPSATYIFASSTSSQDNALISAAGGEVAVPGFKAEVYDVIGDEIFFISNDNSTGDDGLFHFNKVSGVITEVPFPDVNDRMFLIGQTAKIGYDGSNYYFPIRNDTLGAALMRYDGLGNTATRVVFPGSHPSVDLEVGIASISNSVDSDGTDIYFQAPPTSTAATGSWGREIYRYSPSTGNVVRLTNYLGPTDNTHGTGFNYVYHLDGEILFLQDDPVAGVRTLSYNIATTAITVFEDIYTSAYGLRDFYSLANGDIIFRSAVGELLLMQGSTITEISDTAGTPIIIDGTLYFVDQQDNVTIYAYD